MALIQLHCYGLADAVFGFFMFRGDLGDRYLESVFFPILIVAVGAFASFMIWGGTLVRRSDVQALNRAA